MLPSESEVLALLPSLTPPERASLDRLITATPKEILLDWISDDPSRIMGQAGMPPDDWQAHLLRSQALEVLLCCSRQSGKTQTVAALALATALLEPGSLTLILSPTLRQSGEMFRQALLPLYDALGRPVPARRLTQLELSLRNGSRVVSLPESQGGIRGFSDVSLLVLDEAAQVEDGLYLSVRPMLAVSRGRLVAMSTPYGRRGWFYRAWEEEAGWTRYRVPATMCPRLTPEFLAAERVRTGERWWNQEFNCSFEADVAAVFDPQSVSAAFSADVAPL